MVGNVNKNEGIPLDFKLYQNFPNPFSIGSGGNSTTTIMYSIPKFEGFPQVSGISPLKEINIRLKIYDILGREVATLVNEKQAPGSYEVTFDAGSVKGELTPGIYFYTLKAGTVVKTKKMVLLK